MTPAEKALTTTPAESLIPDDAVLVLFGATGDLAKRKLLPGLFHLAVAGLVPRRYRTFGAAPHPPLAAS